MKAELRARFERLGPIQVIPRVPSGSPADVAIRPEAELTKVSTVDAIHALIKRHVPAKGAMRAVDDMVRYGHAIIAVPMIEPGAAFADDMHAAGVEVRRIAEVKPVDVKALRERLRLPVAGFARRFGLNQRTVEGWEQGRPIDAVANVYLHAIAANPDVIARALEQPIT